MNSYKQIEPTERLKEADVAYALMDRAVDSGVLMTFKDVTGVSGELLAGWLHVTPKTLRSYLSRKVLLSDTVGEQVLLLQALFKRGCRMFGSHKAFETWLSRENGLLDGLKPLALLGSVSGIRLVESRLIGLEYGDNA